MRELFNLWLWRGSALVFLVLPVLFAIVGPFGTFTDLGFRDRLVYWSVLVIGVGFLMVIGTVYMLSRLRPRSRVLRVVIGCAVAAVPSTGLVMFMHDVMRLGSDAGRDPASAVLLWVQVFGLGTIISLIEFKRLGYFDLPAGVPAVKPLFSSLPAQPSGAVDHRHAALMLRQSRLFDRLRKELRDGDAELVSMSMQDHYVTLMTTRGPDKLLMRFADAIAEIDALPGVRVHRSHWVAQGHGGSLFKEGNRMMLRLSDGRALPVSKTYLPAVEEMLTAAPT